MNIRYDSIIFMSNISAVSIPRGFYRLAGSFRVLVPSQKQYYLVLLYLGTTQAGTSLSAPRLLKLAEISGEYARSCF
jgi:hypothetical protein